MNQVLIGDCLERMRDIPDGQFDVTFADPPFNLGKKYSSCDDDIELEEYFDWSSKWLSEMERLTKPGGSLFVHNIPQRLARYCCFLGSLESLQFRHWISWDAQTGPMGKSLQPSHYGILYYAKKGAARKFRQIRMPNPRCRTCKKLLKDYGGKKDTINPFGPLVSDVWTDIFRCKHNRSRDDHPCQLPVALMERIILMSTDEGDSVFDPFSGTGTTLVVAKGMGRQYVGIELDERYGNIISNRLDNVMQSKINGMWLSCYLGKIRTVRVSDIMDGEPKNKIFREEWKSLYKNWPQNDDDVREIDLHELKHTDEVEDQLRRLKFGCESRPIVSENKKMAMTSLA